MQPNSTSYPKTRSQDFGRFLRRRAGTTARFVWDRIVRGGDAGFDYAKSIVGGRVGDSTRLDCGVTPRKTAAALPYALYRRALPVLPLELHRVTQHRHEQTTIDRRIVKARRAPRSVGEHSRLLRRTPVLKAPALLIEAPLHNLSRLATRRTRTVQRSIFIIQHVVYRVAPKLTQLSRGTSPVRESWRRLYVLGTFGTLECSD